MEEHELVKADDAKDVTLLHAYGYKDVFLLNNCKTKLRVPLIRLQMTTKTRTDKGVLNSIDPHEKRRALSNQFNSKHIYMHALNELEEKEARKFVLLSKRGLIETVCERRYLLMVLSYFKCNQTSSSHQLWPLLCLLTYLATITV